jgi:hypothetical protein
MLSVLHSSFASHVAILSVISVTLIYVTFTSFGKEVVTISAQVGGWSWIHNCWTYIFQSSTMQCFFLAFFCDCMDNIIYWHEGNHSDKFMIQDIGTNP